MALIRIVMTLLLLLLLFIKALFDQIYFLICYILHFNFPCDGKSELSADPSETIVICLFVAQEIFLIIIKVIIII